MYFKIRKAERNKRVASKNEVNPWVHSQNGRGYYNTGEIRRIMIRGGYSIPLYPPLIIILVRYLTFARQVVLSLAVLAEIFSPLSAVSPI